MKRIKFIVCLVLTLAVSVCAAALAACNANEKEYYGEYHYANPWSSEEPDYGVKVKVKVKSAKDGDTIVGVEIVKSNYVEVTADWEDRDLWDDGVEELLKSYSGKKVKDVLAAKVTVSSSGQPESVDGDFMITGATQGSGRLLLAVQDALK